MEIKSYSKGRTEKTVLVEGTEDKADDVIVAFAMQHANETPVSLFGWRLFRYPADEPGEVEHANVYLFTD